MRSVVHIPVAILFFLGVFLNCAHAQRALPEDNLAYPVLVTIPGVELASGFYLNTPSAIYFVTAKHVLFNEHGALLGQTMTLLSYSKDPKDSTTNLFSLDLAALYAAGEIKRNDHADVAVVRMATPVPNSTNTDPSRVLMQNVAGVTVVHVTDSGVLNAALDTVARYADINIGNEIYVFGYPTSLGIQGTPQLDQLRPLLRKGIIAGEKPDTKSIIIDCPAYPGNSGGPVVEIDRSLSQTTFKIVGLVSQFVPFDQNIINHTPLQSLANSGYTIVTPMDYVLELIP